MPLFVTSFDKFWLGLCLKVRMGTTQQGLGCCCAVISTHTVHFVIKNSFINMYNAVYTASASLHKL